MKNKLKPTKLFEYIFRNPTNTQEEERKDADHCRDGGSASTDHKI
jgi:hypothetical protein